MKEKHTFLLGFLLGLPGLILGLLMLSYYPSNAISFKLGVFISLFGLSGAFLSRIKGVINPYLFLNTLILVYLLGEGVWYLNQPFDGQTGFNKAGAKYDAQVGYRWVSDELRYFKFYDGQTIYDNRFYLNEQKKVVSFNYTTSKSDTIKRFMLFGDSFMEGIMLEENLPNRIYNINKGQEKQHFELYSFAMDGGGILNWNATFFKEVVANYEFDGIVLAMYIDNLYRDYMVMHLQEDISYIGRIETLVEKFEASTFTKPGLKKVKAVYSNEQINSFKHSPEKRFDWPLKKALYRLFKDIITDHQRKETQRPGEIAALQEKMGAKKWEALKAVIEYCEANKKLVILASVPARHLLKEKAEKPNFHQVDMDLIATHYELPYFNGYEVFKGLRDHQIDSLWLPRDGHWNQKGSNLYANALFKYLNQVAKN